MSDLIDHFDGALFDLDGVLYLGPESVVGAPEGLAALRERGVRVGFVTNNAARPREVVAVQLQSLGIEAEAADIVTSAQAAAGMLADTLAPGSEILVVGTQALRDDILARGFRIAEDWESNPVAVVQGLDPDVRWSTLRDAGHAIQRGARWFATNLDMNRPTDLGLEPGTGAQVYVVGTCLPEGSIPEVSGKPYPPLLLETMRRLGVQKPIFVGDRLDTDIEGAHNVAIDSLWVCTGAHTKNDLIHAPGNRRPSYIGFDVRALTAPPRVAQRHGTQVRCGAQQAQVVDARLRLSGPVSADREEQLDALWALAQVAWASGVQEGAEELLAEMDQLP